MLHCCPLPVLCDEIVSTGIECFSRTPFLLFPLCPLFYLSILIISPLNLKSPVSVTKLFFLVRGIQPIHNNFCHAPFGPYLWWHGDVYLMPLDTLLQRNEINEVLGLETQKYYTPIPKGRSNNVLTPDFHHLNLC